MFALIAAIIFFLHGFSILDNSAEVNWLVVGLAFWALHFAFGWGLPVTTPWDRRNP